jgi:serine/threonine protein kinase/tetratricopeptide (TPR) repeat protein
MNHEARNADTIFAQAIEIESPQERAVFLDSACASDLEMRREVEKLVGHHFRAGAFLERPAAHLVGDLEQAQAERPGTMIGPYKLQELLGEGGMGLVFVAEQQRPVRRLVALKVIKPGMDTRQVVARFEAERQALALMDHPHIARVFDGGTTGEAGGISPGEPGRGNPGDPGRASAGRPYFVMELVRGVPITRYCDEKCLTPRERLELFVPVCQAIQHAHQKGIIHRDIKPSNVLVAVQDGKPMPKVIDFGVAKALHQRLTERSMDTAVGAVVGTLEYMSPEQADLRSLDVDTRADLYALGVLLYELLTGTTPFDRKRLRDTAFSESFRIIKEEEPPRPSARLADPRADLAGLAASRRTQPSWLPKEVRGELDWIVMKCLEKDRSRRYDTANGLARDVERYLADEPVEACPPSRGYRLGKFLRKHRSGVLTAATIFLVLVIGMVATTWAMIRAQDAEQLARERLDRAERAETATGKERDKALGAARDARGAEADTKAFGDFLVNDVLAAARPKGVQGGLGVSVTVAEALAAAEGQLEEVFAGRPKAEATARHALGVTWRNLGKYAAAERHLRRAVELRERELGPDDPLTLDSRNSLAVTLERQGRFGAATELYQRNLEASRRLFGPDHPQTLAALHNLAAAYQDAGRADMALPLFEFTLSKQQAALGPDNRATLTTMNNLTFAYLVIAKASDALTLSKRASESAGAALGPEHPVTLSARHNLAVSYAATGQPDKALPMLVQVLQKQTVALGPDHPDTLASMHNLASTYRSVGKLDQSLELFRQTLERRTAALGPDHPGTLGTMTGMAETYHFAGQVDKAIPLLEEALKKQTALLGPDHPVTLTTMHNLARAYRNARQVDKALPLYEQALEKMRVVFGPDHRTTLGAMHNLGEAYRTTRQVGKALPLLEQALEKMRATLGPDHPDTLTAMYHLAQAYRTSGQLDKALPLFRQALENRQAQLGPHHTDTLAVLVSLAEAYQAAGQRDKALPLLEQALDSRKATLGSQHPSTLIDMNNLAEAYRAAGKLDKTLPLLEQAVEGLKANLDPGHNNTLTALANLAYAYQAKGRLDREEPLLREVLAWRRKKDGPKSAAAAIATATLGLNLLKQKKYAEAEPVLRESLAVAVVKFPDDWRTAYTRSMLGGVLLGLENYAEAEPLLLQGYEGMKRREAAIPPQGMPLLAEAAERLVRLYEATGRPEKAAAWRKKLEQTKAAPERPPIR